MADEGMATAIDTLDTAPEVDTDVSTVDTPETDTETEVSTETEEPAVKPQQGPYRAVSEDGKRLDEKARAALDELKAKDPALAKALRDSLFEADRFRRYLPNGIKEVQDLRNQIEEMGGEHGIRETYEEINGWRSFDEQYMAGDPKAIEFMLSSPDTQAAFLKLAPTAMAKYEELHPEGFSTYVCQRIVQDAVSEGLPVAIELGAHFLQAGDVQKAAEQFNKIAGWFKSIDATARRPVQPPKQAQQDNSEVERLRSEQTNREREDWRKETANVQTQVYTSALKSALNGRKVSEAQRVAILGEVQTKLGMRIEQKKDILDRYFAAKDKDGFLRYADSFSKQNIPELVRKAVDRYVPTKPGPKPGAQQQNGQPLQAPIKPANGFTLIPKMPESSQIDWSATSAQAYKSGKAVLRDGKQVQWKR